MKHRNDIDGLRALAVIPVVLFHLDPHWVPGGFAGVDVFFVISGFLITSLLLRDAEGPGISIRGFYDRRIRRIFPALFAMLAVVSVVVIASYLPLDIITFSKSMLTTVFFGSNIYFFKEVNYFAGPAENNLLLHTWSLSVEEQFYIVFPILILLLSKFGRKFIVPTIAVLLVASLVGAELTLHRDAMASFYLPHLRAWELLVGSILATGAIPVVANKIIRGGLGWLGIALIVAGYVLLEERSPFPGVAALLPCLGAGLVIYAGSKGETGSWSAAKLLSLPVFTFIGLISYSLYLWHWPIIVLAKYGATSSLALETKLLCGVLALGCAYLSWRFVERPFRKPAGVGAKAEWKTIGFGLASMAAATVTGVFLVKSGGLSDRFAPSVMSYANATLDGNPRYEQCFGWAGKWLDPQKPCNYGAASDVTPRVMVWGDSHGDALVPTLGAAMAKRDEGLLFFGYAHCPPLLGVGYEPVGPFKGSRCFEHNRLSFEYIRDTKSITTVVLVARWPLYLQGYATELGPAEKPTPNLVTDETGRRLNEAEKRALIFKQFDATVRALRAADKRVYIVTNPPEVGFVVPTTLAVIASRGGKPDDLTIPRAGFTSRSALANTMIAQVDGLEGVTVVRPDALFCTENACRLAQNGRSLYKDDDHLSNFGAELVSADLVPRLHQP